MNSAGRALLGLRLGSGCIRSSLELSPKHSIQTRSLTYVRKLVRTPIRVYEHGEQAPATGSKRPTIKLPSAEPPQEESSTAVFNSVMGNIHRNKVRKQIALEGTRMVEEALLAGLKLEKLFLLKSLKEVPEKINSLMSSETEIHKVGQKQMQVWSSLTTPPGLIGIFPKPKEGEIVSRSEAIEASDGRAGVPIPMTVLCDNLREPGNLGSLLRSAAGAGCARVLLSKGCVDAWDGKVLRGGCGAHFRMPILEDIPLHALGALSCPTDPSLDSHHVGIFLADSNSGDSRSDLPLLSYTDVAFTELSQVFLIVGGETEGLGTETLKISARLRPPASSPVRATVARLHIPLQSQMESLNVANAFGIIAFEVQRQFALQHHFAQQARLISEK